MTPPLDLQRALSELIGDAQLVPCPLPGTELSLWLLDAGNMDRAFSHLESRYNDGKDWKLHYVSAREMYNIVKAAEQGLTGDPGQYRDHLIPRPTYCPEHG